MRKPEGMATETAQMEVGPAYGETVPRTRRKSWAQDVVIGRRLAAGARFRWAADASGFRAFVALGPKGFRIVLAGHGVGGGEFGHSATN